MKSTTLLTQPMTIRAYLQQGISMDTRVGIALDSLLASVIRHNQKVAHNLSGKELDGGALHINEVEHVPLPLAPCNLDEWHWNASTGQLFTREHQEISLKSIPEIHPLLRSSETHRFEKESQNLPRVLSPKSGRWRAWKIPTPIIPASYVQWTAIGAPEEVYRLLKQIDSLGHRRSAGEGRVIKWELEVTNQTSAGHLHADGITLGRPLLPECLKAYDLDTDAFTQGLIGIRPPYWHMGNQRKAYY